ncbi:MAG: chorismate mutase [Deltaproteobacteria bacterium]|nr:chorismate mutase [Deltaproteobacteria bacterium]
MSGATRADEEPRVLEPPSTDLAARRRELDDLDGRMLELLEQRRDLVAAIWEHKRAAGVPLLDEAREAAILERIADEGLGRGLGRAAVRAWMRAVLDAMHPHARDPDEGSR